MFDYNIYLCLLIGVSKIKDRVMNRIFSYSLFLRVSDI